MNVGSVPPDCRFVDDSLKVYISSPALQLVAAEAVEKMHIP